MFWRVIKITDMIRTIEDLEKLYYSRKGLNFLSQNDLNADFVNKVDDPVLTSTTGVYNAVFGAQAWVQLNMEANSFSMMGKFPWSRSGWRVISARSGTQPYGGQTVTGTLPESVKPTFAEVSTVPKISALVFEVNEVQEYLASVGAQGDDTYANMVELKAYMANEHREDLNAQLNTENGTLAGTNFESLDRVVGNNTEISTLTQSGGGAYTAGDLDMYASSQFDRDSGTSWRDAYMSGATSDRSLTDAIIQTVMQNTLNSGANRAGQVWQTGYDTWATINQLYDTQVRYNIIGEAKIQPGVNGILSLEGHGVGLTVAKLHHAALIESKNTVKDTISRLYLFDISNPEGFDYPRLYLKIAKPTQFFEAGINAGSPFAVDKFSDKGMYRTMGELKCSFFAAQGKARDLKG